VNSQTLPLFPPEQGPVPDEKLLLDANVLITAHHGYYAPDLCPGFWECIQYHCNAGRLLIIDRVRDEINGPELLVQWMTQIPASLFVPTDEKRIVDSFGEMMAWVQGNDQFLIEAKEEFARVADGWLAAYAREHDAVVVTNEAFNPNVKRKVPLPNLCLQFDISCIDTFSMLRNLGVRFDWRP